MRSMLDDAGIEKLLTLSRLSATNDERVALKDEIQAILGYVAKVAEASTNELTSEYGDVVNVLRDDSGDDVDAYLPDQFTDVLLRAVPQREGRYVKVKKVL